MSGCFFLKHGVGLERYWYQVLSISQYRYSPDTFFVLAPAMADGSLIAVDHWVVNTPAVITAAVNVGR